MRFEREDDIDERHGRLADDEYGEEIDGGQ